MTDVKTSISDKSVDKHKGCNRAGYMRVEVSDSFFFSDPSYYLFLYLNYFDFEQEKQEAIFTHLVNDYKKVEKILGNESWLEHPLSQLVLSISSLQNDETSEEMDNFYISPNLLTFQDTEPVLPEIFVPLGAVLK